MAHSDILAGPYAIRPIDGPQDRYINIRPHIPIEPPPEEVPVDLGSDRFPWTLKDTKTHTFTVHAQRYNWIIKDSALIVSAKLEGVGLIFKRDDTGFVTIDDPGFVRSSRLTFHKDAPFDDPPFTFQEAQNGSRAQLFEIIKINP